MRIVRVAVLEFYRRLDGRSWNPTMRWHERRAPLLVVETDAGLSGVGEAWSRQPEIALVLDYLAERRAPALLGHDPTAREQIVAELAPLPTLASPWVAAAAASAVDITLWNPAAQANGQPPVVASEAEHRHEMFLALLDARAVTHLQYCLGLCGGLSGALRLDAFAAEHHVTSTPECFSTAVLQAASLHLGAARENVVAVEFHCVHDHLAAALPCATRTIASGCVQLDATPGLGVRPPSPGEQPGGGEVRLYRQSVLHH